MTLAEQLALLDTSIFPDADELELMNRWAVAQSNLPPYPNYAARVAEMIDLDRALARDWLRAEVAKKSNATVGEMLTTLNSTIVG
jgi:hypothetical protein